MDWINLNVGIFLLVIALLNFPFALYQLWRKTFSVDRVIRPFKVLASLVVFWALFRVLQHWEGANAYGGWLLTAAIFVKIGLALAIPFTIGGLLGHTLAWVVWKVMKARP